nr:condensation domain-containing protein [Acidobacteriota bacterium]
VSLTADETAALLGEVLRPYHLRADEVLLTALGLALCEWTRSGSVLIGVESHGREELFADLHPARTIGWFTSLAPVLLELPPDGGPGASLIAVKEQLRRVPHRGIGHGLLRYLGDPVMVRRLRAQPAPEVVFNFLGRLGQAVPDSALFVPAPEAVGSGRDPLAPRTHILEVNSSIVSNELHIEMTYGTDLHHAATIDRLTRSLETHLHALMEHCRSAAAGRLTPSDFPLAELDQQKVDKIVARFSSKRGGER